MASFNSVEVWRAQREKLASDAIDLKPLPLHAVKYADRGLTFDHELPCQTSFGSVLVETPASFLELCQWFLGL
jgi:hypothetical protein